MVNTWVLSALRVDLALIAMLLPIWFGMSTTLSQIVTGPVARLVIGVASCRLALGSNATESGKAVRACFIIHAVSSDIAVLPNYGRRVAALEARYLEGLMENQTKQIFETILVVNEGCELYEQDVLDRTPDNWQHIDQKM